MPEILHDKTRTTVDTSYTAGSGTLNVADASGITPDCSVDILDQADLSSVKARLRVTAKSTNALTVASEGVDTNASGGDIVAVVQTKTSLAAYVQQSGAVISPINIQLGTVSDWRNYTIIARIHGYTLNSFRGSFKVLMQFAGGSPVIGGMKILRTLIDDTAVIDKTTVQIGASSTPTLSTPTFVYTDAIALTRDITHDYCFAIFFADNAANSSIYTVTGGGAPAMFNSGFVAGDQSNVDTIPSLGFSNNPYLVRGLVNA